MEDAINVITDRYDKAQREKALKVLELAKQQEAEKLKKGYTYIETENKTWKLIKDDDSNLQPNSKNNQVPDKANNG